MTPAEQFYLGAIAFMAAIVGVMIGIVGTVRLLVWLDDRRIRGPIDDDLDVQEYRDAALIDWSTSVWAELDREAS